VSEIITKFSAQPELRGPHKTVRLYYYISHIRAKDQYFSFMQANFHPSFVYTIVRCVSGLYAEITKISQ
jgi:hypothetical protein